MVDVKIGGRGRVGGILIDEHEVKFDDKQQNDVAFGDVRPQYVHNCGKFVPKPQFCGSFTRPSTHDELSLDLGLGRGYLRELLGRAQTVKSALIKFIRRSVTELELPPQNSGVMTIVSSLVAKSAHVLAQTGGLN